MRDCCVLDKVKLHLVCLKKYQRYVFAVFHALIFDDIFDLIRRKISSYTWFVLLKPLFAEQIP